MTVALVVIDAKQLPYCRYLGKHRVLKVQATEPMTKAEVEAFRTDPLNLINRPPEAA